jgi:hypothetical protein
MDDFNFVELPEGFIEWLNALSNDHPDSFFVVAIPVEDEIPYEAYDMDKRVHFKRQCPHHNMHGTRDVELELDGHHVLMRAYLNGTRMIGPDGEWPVVQRLANDEAALRFYLRIRRGFVAQDFEIVDA